MTQGQVQLGKKGITENFIETLKNHFKKNKNVKVSVLKSAGHEKRKVREFADEILKKLNSRPRTANNKNNLLPTTKSLGKKYTAKIIGFTISLKKWRRAVPRKRN